MEISKAQQFTDWSLRPLKQEQIDYALGDVIYLDTIYHELKKRLKDRNRDNWVTEDMKSMTDPNTFAVDPMRMWEKIKIRSDKPRHLGILREVAAIREEKAMERNMPRNFIVRDETLMEIAMTGPKDEKSLERVRGFPTGAIKKSLGREIIAAVKRINTADPKTLPKREKRKPFPADKAGVLEMLRLLMKIEAAHHDITPSRIATSDDLQLIAIKGAQAEVKAMTGWRYDIFGSKCVDLMEGRIGLSLKNGEIDISEIEPR